MDYMLSDFISDCADISRQDSVQLADFEAPFRKFLGSTDLYSAINKELFAAASNPLYVSPNLRGNSLIIHIGPGWTLIYSLYEHVPAHLYTLPLQGLISPLGNCSFEYDVYDLPADYNNPVFNRDVRLSARRSIVAAPGDVVAFDGARVVTDMRIAAPVGVLKFLIPNQHALQWTFDRASLAPIQAISATASGSELAFIAQVLGVLKNQSSVIKLRHLAKDHPQHNVRWEAVKAIGRINPEAGLEVVRAATLDKHPHIVAAAQRTLARYQAS